MRNNVRNNVRKNGRKNNKFLSKKGVKIILIVAVVSLVLLVAAPGIAINIFLNGHVDYKGYVMENNSLQDIYEASDYGLKEKQIYVKTSDNLDIWTSEIYTENPKAVIIYLSGILQPSVTYFYGHAKYMKDKGYASFLLEVRGHGKSDGDRICLGYEEVKDVQAVVDYIKSKEEYNDVPIIIQGVSMGGAIAVNSFGQIKEIDGLIAMSAYSSFEEVIGDKLDSFGMPGFIVAAGKGLLKTSLSLIFDQDTVAHMKPIEQIKNSEGRPMLLVACTGDTEVMVSNIYRLKGANPEAKVWIRDSWEHFIIKDCDFINVKEDEEYFTRVLEFIEKDVLN